MPNKIIVEPELLLALKWGNQYFDREIADIFNCCIDTIRHKIKQQKIGRAIIIEPELLWALHWGDDFSQRAIANIFKVSRTVICYKFKKYNIPSKKIGAHSYVDYEMRNDKRCYNSKFRDESRNKHCHSCDKWLPESAFGNANRPKDKLMAACKDCNRQYGRELHWVHRQQILFFYSKGTMKCSLCGYDKDIGALDIDHINGGGNKHRNELTGHGTAFARWLIDNEFPGGYRILCCNCNRLERLRLNLQRVN